MVTEQRGTLEAGRRGHVVIRVSSTQLCHICMIDNIRYYCQSSSYYRITIVILLMCIVIV